MEIKYYLKLFERIDNVKLDFEKNGHINATNKKAPEKIQG
jgi:hypothetical protein